MADKAEKAALALELAHKLVMEAFPVTTTTLVNGSEGYLETQDSPGPFWAGIDMNDAEAKKERLREMTMFIGVLSQNLETGQWH